MMKYGFIMFSLIAVLTVGIHDGRAITITLDNGAPDLSVALPSDFDYPAQHADYFWLAEGDNTITDVHFWGLYAFQQTPSAPDDFTIRIYSDAGGLPDTDPFFQIDVGDIGRTETSYKVSNTYAVYEYWAGITPTTVNPGVTYWMSIVNNTALDADDNWYWVTSAVPGNAMARAIDADKWALAAEMSRMDFGFDPEPNDPTTQPPLHSPEPATMLLLGTGLVGLAGYSRRKFKKKSLLGG